MVDVSCILTLHAEGALAFRTLRAIDRTRRHAHEHGLSTELIISLDSADDATIAEAERASRMYPDVTLRHVNLRDLGPHRMDAISHSRGTYVAIFDGDDIVCEDWLASAFVVASKSPLYVVHPSVTVTFGKSSCLHWIVDQESPAFDPSNLILENYWTAMVFGHRSMFEKAPYQSTLASSGFGYEDWHWNCEVIAQGGVHKVAPETVYFVRIKSSGSLLQEQAAKAAVIRDSTLFHMESFWRPRDRHPADESIDVVADHSHPTSWRYAPGKAFFRITKDYPRWLRAHSRSVAEYVPAEWDEHSFLVARPDVATAVRRGKYASAFQYAMETSGGRALGQSKTTAGSGERHEPWLIRELEKAQTIEPALLEFGRAVDTLPKWQPVRSSPAGQAFAEFLSLGPHAYTHVIIAPWLARGGSDLAVLHHLDLLVRNDANRVLLILTVSAPSPWLSRVPQGVQVLQFGALTGTLGPVERAMLLTRVLITAGPDVIHNFNSQVAWDAILAHGRALSRTSQLYASVFGRMAGYALNVGDTFHFLCAVLSDSQKILETYESTYGFDSRKFVSIRYPVELRSTSRRGRITRIFRILWASRFDAEKRPDLLLAIASRLPDIEFHVYGEQLFPAASVERTRRRLGRMMNVALKGAYADARAIEFGAYDLFLYTSEDDGLPNVILEAMSCGLPVLAPRIGGIPEVIPAESGFLVDRFDDVDAYVRRIRALLANADELERESVRCRELIAREHSFAAFSADVARIPGYLAPMPLQSLRERNPPRGSVVGDRRSAEAPRHAGTLEGPL